MPPIGQVCIEPNITVEVINRFGAVDSFVYLGSTLSRNSSLDAGISSRIAKVSTAFGKLEKRVWSDRGITTNTKLSVYYMRLVSLQLVIIYIYGSETWSTCRHHVNLLEMFYQNFAFAEP